MAEVRARVVDPADWQTVLAGTELGKVTLSPDHSIVLVVEVDGVVAACWAAINTVHVEGIEVLPPFKGDPGVARALLSGMADELRKQGIGEVLTQAATPEMEAMIERVGGERVPGSTWVIRP